MGCGSSAQASQASAPKSGPPPLSEVEELWLRAIFERCKSKSGEVEAIKKKDLIDACTRAQDLGCILGVNVYQETLDTKPLEARFIEAAGAEETPLNLDQLRLLYRKCLGAMQGSDRSTAEGAPEPQEVTEAESKIVAEALAKANNKANGEAVSWDHVRRGFQESFEEFANPSLLFGLRPTIRKLALERMKDSYMALVQQRMLSSTHIEDDPFHVGDLENGVSSFGGRSIGDEDEPWLQAILQAYKEKHPDNPLPEKHLTKAFFRSYCGENIPGTIAFVFRRRVTGLPWSDAITDVLIDFAKKESDVFSEEAVTAGYRKNKSEGKAS